MKKILGISLVAVLAVSPMMAMAEGELGSAVTIAGPLNDTTGSAFTTQSYVKGAYNAVEGDLANVNAAVTTLNGSVTDDGSVLKAIKDTAANASYSASTNYAENTIGAAIKNAISVSGTSAGAGLSKDTQTGVFSVNVDDTTIGIDATGNTLEVKDGSIGATQLSQAVNTSLGLANSAVQPGNLAAVATTGAASDITGLATVATTGAASDITTDTSHEFVTAQQKTDWAAAAAAISDTTNGLDTKQAQLTNGTNNIDATVKTSIATGENGDNASDTALLTEKAVYDAIQAAAYDDTALAGRVTANENAITTINGKQIPVATTWGGAGGNDTTTTVTISSLGPVVNGGGD